MKMVAGLVSLIRKSFVVPICFLGAILASATADAQVASHPLDGLTEREHWAIRSVLSKAGQLTDDTQLVRVLLRDPPKDEVLKWQRGKSFSRHAVIEARRGGKTYEGIVDVRKKKLERWRRVEGAHTGGHWSDSRDLITAKLKKHPDWITALKKRGITDQGTLFITPVSQGFTDVPKDSPNRMLKWAAFQRRGVNNFHGRPIEGLIAVVDMDRREILRVIDTGAVPIPDGPVDFDERSVGKLRKRPAPLRTVQPRGPGFRVNGHEVTWQNWHFHFRIDPRVGPVVSQVTYKDGDRTRSILYQGHLSELFVPYMDPAMGWRDRAYLDFGENAGGLVTPIEPGLDCPAYARLFASVVADITGIPQRVERAAALFELDPGAMSWRHWDFVTKHTESRPRRILVLRTIATLGNYDYVFDWIFQQNGAIRVRVGSTGIDQAKSVARRDLNDGKGEAPYGRFVAPHTVAVNHDHYFCYRLDLDIDGVKNSFLREALKPVTFPNAPRRKVWVVDPKIIPSEKEARMKMNMSRPGLWRIINPSVKGAVGNPVSYHLRPMGNGLTLLTDDEYPGGRGGFTHYHFWVTPRRENELYADGRYPFRQKRDGLLQWTEQDRKIENTDIVAWYTLGFHHVVRVEDWPVMPTKWDQFEIRPYNFFDRNPAVNLPK